MKGIVFNLLEEVVCDKYGVDVWDDLLDAAQVPGSYTSLGSYPDADMVKLATAAAAALDLPLAEVLRWFGREAMPHLAKRFAPYFGPHPSLKPFVLSLNSIIHPEVHKLYPGASCPVFTFQDGDDGALLIGYRSPRRLCALAHGFLEGAAAQFGETVTVAHLRCMHQNDDACLMKVTTGPATG